VDNILYKGYSISIEQDENPYNPRYYNDNLGIMVCFHGRYDLGDKTDLTSKMFENWNDLEEHLFKKERAKYVTPLYLYDHSGITISAEPFSCPWDSGQIGFIYTTSKRIREQFKHKKLCDIADDIIQQLLSEVKIYDQYLTGDIYGYMIKKDDIDIDSCWGFYGYDETLQEAKSIVDSYKETV